MHHSGASQQGMSREAGGHPCQGGLAAGTRQNIDSWAKHHEAKWRRVPVAMEWKVPVHRGRTFLGLTPALMDGGEGKRSFSRVSFDGVKMIRVARGR